MKSYRTLIVIATALALAFVVAACKKKETKPTVATAGTAKTAEVAITCPKPGEDLICQQCKTLFMTDKEYAEHMEKQHPQEWAKIKDQFWEGRKGGTAGTAKTK